MAWSGGRQTATWWKWLESSQVWRQKGREKGSSDPQGSMNQIAMQGIWIHFSTKKCQIAHKADGRKSHSYRKVTLFCQTFPFLSLATVMVSGEEEEETLICNPQPLQRILCCQGHTSISLVLFHPSTCKEKNVPLPHPKFPPISSSDFSQLAGDCVMLETKIVGEQILGGINKGQRG